MNQELIQSPYYDVKDLARIFGVNPRTIWRWVSLGTLPEPVRWSKKILRWAKERIDPMVGNEGKPS